MPNSKPTIASHFMAASRAYMNGQITSTEYDRIMDELDAKEKES